MRGVRGETGAQRVLEAGLLFVAAGAPGGPNQLAWPRLEPVAHPDPEDDEDPGPAAENQERGEAAEHLLEQHQAQHP